MTFFYFVGYGLLWYSYDWNLVISIFLIHCGILAEVRFRNQRKDYD